MSSFAFARTVAVSSLFAAGLLAGCHTHVLNAAEAKAQEHAQAAEQRQELDGIPPPSKSSYMAIRNLDSWANPYITVQPDMLTIHVLLADENPSSFGAGGMLRPVGARRQVVNIRADKLGDAMSSIPQTSWPYGRVVAVEEAHQTPGKQEPMVRRNMESTVSTLNDLGIVAYDLSEGNLR